MFNEKRMWNRFPGICYFSFNMTGVWVCIGFSERSTYLMGCGICFLQAWKGTTCSLQLLFVCSPRFNDQPLFSLQSPHLFHSMLMSAPPTSTPPQSIFNNAFICANILVAIFTSCPPYPPSCLHKIAGIQYSSTGCGKPDLGNWTSSYMLYI